MATAYYRCVENAAQRLTICYTAMDDWNPPQTIHIKKIPLPQHLPQKAHPEYIKTQYLSGKDKVICVDGNTCRLTTG